MQTENTIEYKGHTIKPETDEWALKYGLKFFFHETCDTSMEKTISAGSIEEAKEMIDDLTCNENE